MRPRRTPSSNFVYRLPGGTEDNDLHCRVEAEGTPCVASVWDLEPHERAAIGAGANIELTVIGGGHPPVQLGVTREQPTSRPTVGVEGEHTRLWVELEQAHAVEVLIALTHYRTQVLRADADPDACRRLASIEQLLRGSLEALDQDDDEAAAA